VAKKGSQTRGKRKDEEHGRVRPSRLLPGAGGSDHQHRMGQRRDANREGRGLHAVATLQALSMFMPLRLATPLSDVTSGNICRQLVFKRLWCRRKKPGDRGEGAVLSYGTHTDSCLHQSMYFLNKPTHLRRGRPFPSARSLDERNPFWKSTVPSRRKKKVGQDNRKPVKRRSRDRKGMKDAMRS